MLGAIIGTIAIVLVTIAIGLWIDRKTPVVPRGQPPARKPRAYAAGEAPSTAIRAGDAQIARLRASQRCPACRAAMTEEPDDTVRYDDRELLVLAFRCPACSARRSLYIARAP